MNGRSALAALLIVGSAVSARAQGVIRLPVGSRLRVTTPALTPKSRIGVFQARRDSILFLQTKDAFFTVAVSSITRVELSTGRKMSKTGGVVGLLLGAGVGGFALGCLANRDDYGVLCGGQDDTKVVVGVIVGGLVGATIGALLFRNDRWRSVDLALLR